LHDYCFSHLKDPRLIRIMNRLFSVSLLPVLLLLLTGTSSFAASTVEMFEIEGLISPASPKALSEALESQLEVKVVDLNLKNTDSGWPVLSLEFDSTQVSRQDVEQAIAKIEDPAGHKYRVHVGPPMIQVPFSEEENEAMAMFGPPAPSVVSMVNPVSATDESLARGKILYESNCTTCHGLSGNGNGPAAHGITTFPRQLWAWNGSDSSADGYLFWFITNGRNEMPPWGLIMSENDRWDIINYIKTLEKP
jgi:mono/diheme cytochrome c family protein